MIVYTRAAVDQLGGVDATEGKLIRSIVALNYSFRASNVDVLVNLVALCGIDYRERSLSTDLMRLSAPADHHFDEVHALRDSVGADLVVLVTGSDVGAGTSNQFQAHHLNNASFAEKAFAVVAAWALRDSLVLVHEVGHLMGAQHERASAAQVSGAFPFTYGRVQSRPRPPCRPWKTIMAVGPECLDCTTLPIWSGPQTNVCGEASGRKGLEDNANGLEQAAVTVAAFRTPQPSVPRLGVARP